LKRLLVGGFERVYELNRNFRNEGIGYRWNPEFTMLEFYCAYMDVNGMMDFCEEMLRTTIKTARGDRLARFGDDEIDFGREFKRLTMKEAILQHWQKYWHSYFGEIPSRMHAPEVWLDNSKNLSFLSYFQEYRQQQFDFSWSRTEEHENKSTVDSLSQPIKAGQDMASIFEVVAEELLIQPTLITDFPKSISPLSKASPDDPSVAERFELYCAGMEIANGFSELNDPVEQYARFEDQARQRERGDEEAMQTDVDYVRALSYGMPPAAGIGIGVDRLTMLLTNKKSIRDVILFPHMRPQAAKSDEQETEEP
ncbi:MAG: amino acid--tRNA ligase-related protein, partial [Pyrinomonadaceae bacterium]